MIKQIFPFCLAFKDITRINYIPKQHFKTAMMTYGEKYPEKDVDVFFEATPIEDGKMDAQYIGDMLLGKLDE